MYVVAIAWLYVVVLMALAEGVSGQGSWLGAAITLLLYGLMPLAIVLYLLGTPGRRQARRAEEAAAQAAALQVPLAPGLEPGGRGHAAGDAVAPVGKEP